MKNLKLFLALSIAILASSVVTIGQNYASNVTISPQTIAREAYKKIRYLPYYDVFDNITVSVSGSTVTLGGKVHSLSTRKQAERVVEDIPGVTQVINNIDNLPPSPMDDRIRRAAYLTFIDRGPGQYFSDLNPDVRIIVENGRITLEGFVTRKSDSDTLNILANGISGVFEVTNNIVVGRDSRRS